MNTTKAVARNKSIRVKKKLPSAYLPGFKTKPKRKKSKCDEKLSKLEKMYQELAALEQQ